MRIPARRRRADLGFNLTAMIDVVFNLIVFFLVASHFSKADSDDPVQLPTASQAANQSPIPIRAARVTIASSPSCVSPSRPPSRCSRRRCGG